jgi:hypothetical protein
MPKTLSFAEDDPFPGIADGAEVGSRQPINPRTGDPVDGSAPISCPAGTGRSQVANATTKEQYLVCVKNWRPAADVNADIDFRNRQESARAAAEAESKAWNAANPGKQKCVQWGPVVHANGVSTASGGVCANPVDPGPNTSVPTQSAPSVEAPTISTSTSSSTTPSASGNTSSSSETTTSTSSTSSGSTNTTSTTTSASTAPTEDFSKWGSGTPFTRVLKGQLSTSECPSGFQAANGIIVAIGSGTFTECWPENAWSAYRLGGSIWDQFKSSGGNYDAKAELDRRKKVTELRSLAKSVAQAAADQTPGIQRCSKWTGYGESGEECAYTFVKPSSTSTSGSTTSNSSSSETTTVTSNSSTSSSSSSGASSAASSADPYPNLNNGDEIPNTRITSTAGLTQFQWEQTSLYKGHTCPSGSGKATGVDLNFTVSQSDDKWFVYCVKSILSTTIPISDSGTVSTSEGSKTNSNSGNSETSTATTSTSSQNSSSSNTPSTINTDSSTATTSSSSTTSPSTGSSGTTSTTQTSTPTLQSRAIEVNGTVSELKSLVGKVVENQKEAKSISTLINRLDSVVSKTSVKQIKLPGSSQVEEIAESKTPEICSVLGVTVNSLKKGTCIISYTVVDSDGNKFNTQKEIYFRK